ncbi:uncharacterized protein LOC112566499 [Pomacea canaliculata]|uniref:uncharacterized protein LOC112566499 n=1 Tax=Pomacea canaliculata TaxID=400727 RepID=UPI000D734663|nr:uncharacterized protein LOC112566499 [Pomacea canaliculata]
MNNPFLKYLPLLYKEPRSNVVGIGRGRITWRYTPERLGMANVTEHPANQGIINGIAPNGDAQEEDLIARKLTEMQDIHLLPIKEDIAEWITHSWGRNYSKYISRCTRQWNSLVQTF